MRKLIDAFKKLPREIKIVIAMAGLGTPTGLVYALKQWVFPQYSFVTVLFIVLGFVVVLCLLGWIIMKLFGRGKSKRRRHMESELAGDSGGPTSMDVAAAIKENNSKFFNAVKDMRKNIGLSVYDLPWYIVIGSPGCGKTKLINEGGLQFSTGKPEGYQLGTLNYNWWFSEDAVFIDMAGRLCNPRDDADRREWEAFLNTVAKGRKGYPINGAIVCVSADHLLADPPEQIEQDANTSLERLRDLQTKLGVTFATYLVITKCDKIVGFMQLFDRAEKDIRVLNQMVGWSKPGEFNELYDPEEFPTDFEAVYRRLHDIRIRRLNDDADEIDLGLAYCFPEEFRELKEPLSTYIRTLFPKIKNPRAIKNLLFRGVYFTSATREGGLILKHLTERLGPEAGEQFQPLDLYPSKRPYFIRDFFFRKMFPEHGLVFRNEQEAVRNRKLARFLKFGGIGLGVVLFSLVGLGAWKFGEQISEPSQLAVNTDEESPAESGVALERSTQLASYASGLDGSPWAKVLTLYMADYNRPVRDLYTVHAGLFEYRLLSTVLEDVGMALRSAELPHPGDDKAAVDRGREYLLALREYVRWYGCGANDGWRGEIDEKSFRTMVAILRPEAYPDVLINRDRETFMSQADIYFRTAAETEEWASPARYLEGGDITPKETIEVALDNAREYLKAYASLDARNPQPVIREWMRIRSECEVAADAYQAILSAAGTEFRTSADLESFRQAFIANVDKMAGALGRTDWQAEASLDSLRNAILKQREEQWLAYEKELNGALLSCGTEPDGDVTSLIAALSAGGIKTGLDEVLWESLRASNLTQQTYEARYFADREAFMRDVEELYVPYDYMIEFVEDAKANNQKLAVTEEADTVMGALNQIREALPAGFARHEPAGDLGDWVTFFQEFGRGGRQSPPAPGLRDLRRAWSPDNLATLYDEHESLIRRGQLRSMLDTIQFALGNTGDWGVAELYADGFEPTESVYYIPEPAVEKPAKSQEKRADAPPAKDSNESTFVLPGRTQRSQPSTDVAAAVADGTGSKPRCTRDDFLRARLEESFNLLFLLNQVDTRQYLVRGGSANQPLHEECADLLEFAVTGYLTQYATSWSEGYGKKALSELQSARDASTDWQALADHLARRSGRAYGDISDEFKPALHELLASLPFARCYPEGGAYRCDPYDGYSEWIEIKGWMNRALGRGWNNAARAFLREARPVDLPLFAKDPPWTAIAKEFKARWDDLGARLVETRDIPNKFDPRPSSSSASNRRIPWGAIQEFRDETGLTDERMTGELVEFELRAQQLLSEAITESLWSVQQQQLNGAYTSIGWPYLDDKVSNANMQQTVDFEGFKQFLLEVRNAESYFSPLERSLPDDDTLKTRRQALYGACNAWFEFLGMADGRKLQHKDLTITEVEYFDPLANDAPVVGDRPGKTPQQYYEESKLDLGLTIREGPDSQMKRQPITVQTWAEKRDRSAWEARWKWDSGGEFEFMLAGGKRIGQSTQKLRTVRKRIGEVTPLALCAYLETGKSEGDRRTWATVEMIDLPEALDEVGQKAEANKRRSEGVSTVGAGFRFTLERSLPEAIRMIEKPRGR